MVLLNAGKAARNAASIVNRPTCGGDKKGGLAPTIGAFISSNPNLIGVYYVLIYYIIFRLAICLK